jgi:putative membrane protein
LIVLVAWIAAFCLLLQGVGGMYLIAKFLRPDYWWLVEIGAAILIIFVIANVYCDPHNRGKKGVTLLVQIGILLLPLLYLPQAVMSELSPEALEKRSIDMTHSGQSSMAAKSPKTEAADLPNDPSLLRLVTDAKSYEGRKISTIGMVYTNDKLPQNTFFCYQLLMFCCAADARPVGVLVKYDESSSLTVGSWIKVEGKLGIETIEDKQIIQITAERVESIDPPKEQFLFQ